MYEYRIMSFDNQFVVIDSLDEVVGKYDAEGEAKRVIAECERQDQMYESAKALVESVIKAHMQKFGIVREIASYWIRSAAEVT